MRCLSGGAVENVGEARLQVLAGLPAVVVDEASRRARRRRAAMARGDRLVLVPDRLALARLLQHRAHDAAQVHPVRARARADQRVARGVVDGVVEGDVGLDHRLDVAAARGAPAGLDELGIEHGAAPGGEPGGERVERAAHFVDLGDPARRRAARRGRRGRARRGRGRPSSAGAAPAARAGARRRGRAAIVFLRQARAGRERAVADRVEQGAVDLVDEVGRGLQLDEVGGHRRCGLGLCIQNTIADATARYDVAPAPNSQADRPRR